MYPAEPALLVFAREPLPGKAKTRLAATLPPLWGEPGAVAADFYAACLEDLFQTLNSLPFLVLPCVTPDSDPKYFSRFTAGPVLVQEGATLGERLRAAFARGFSYAPKLLLIGSDLPQLRQETLRTAVAVLDTHDGVLGPAEDGGYYLIGFRKGGFCECFHGVAWSTDQVLEQTLGHLRNRKIALLEHYRDIDCFADLDALARSGQCPAALMARLGSYGY